MRTTINYLESALSLLDSNCTLADLQVVQELIMSAERRLDELLHKPEYNRIAADAEQTMEGLLRELRAVP